MIAPVAVIIPTFNRGVAVHSVLEKILHCNPRPAEILVHIDAADGQLEAKLRNEFPDLTMLTSPVRLGPGGGRHRCLACCKMPYAVSFDDDSWPVDVEFFSDVVRLFSKYPHAAVFEATIWHRDAAPIPINDCLVRSVSFTGCGHAIRVSAYREVRGYLPRTVAYGMEEIDLALQLFAAGWDIYKTGRLRVFHDTEFIHHASSEIVSGYVTNVGLFAFLNYPVIRWYWGLLQLANAIVFSVRRGRIHGLCTGLLRLPLDCYRNRHYRNPIDWATVRRFLQFRRSGIPA
jgi:GT2 family glycosyltransferase